MRVSCLSRSSHEAFAGTLRPPSGREPLRGVEQDDATSTDFFSYGRYFERPKPVVPAPLPEPSIETALRVRSNAANIEVLG
jgi:hypothetical protein